MRVLFTSPVLEHPAAGGPQLRIENSILALNRVSELYVVSRVDKNKLGGEEAEQFYRQNCREFVYAPSANRLSANRYARLLQQVFNKILLSDDADFILDSVDRHKIDVIWFGYGNVSYSLIKKIKAIRSDIKVVCDTDSVWSRFVLRELPFEKDPARRKKIELEGKAKEHEERGWVNLCDVTTAVSKIDKEYYRSIADNPERVMLFSNVIDLASYSSPPLPPTAFRRPTVYLAGTFWPQSPMEQAARWLLDEIWSLVRCEVPNAHLYIVGSGSQKVLADIDDPSVTVTGKLPSVLQYLCNADVALVPLKFESGTRFKILEAGACAIPVVSTTLGAEGIPTTSGHDILIADTPEYFAKAIISVINDRQLAESLGVNLKELVSRYYSVDALAIEGQAILDHLLEIHN
jgi:glycosyltransferase involved in cell wall biosynthesis